MSIFWLRPALAAAIRGGHAQPYYLRVLGIARADLVSYWPIWEPSGTTANDISGNGYNGVYTDTVLGQMGIGDGKTAGQFNDSSSIMSFTESGLPAAVDPTELTIAFWYKVRAASVWTDATYRYLANVRVDNDNLIRIYKSTTANRITCQYIAGAVEKNANISAFTSTDWIHIGLTISKTANEMRAYLNGQQAGATITGLGTWVGTPTSAYLFSCADGYGAHGAIFNRALTPTEMQRFFPA